MKPKMKLEMSKQQQSKLLLNSNFIFYTIDSRHHRDMVPIIFL
jgi:hypothetical protein